MAPLGRLLWMAWLEVENHLVASILRMPGFHHGVRRIHRTVHELRHGRNPHEPLRPGEATDNQEVVKPDTFLRHFLDEIKNQARGTPTNPPSNPLPPRKP